MSIIQAMFIHGMIVQGLSEGQHYGPAVVGSPKKNNLNVCMRFGERVARLVLALHGSQR